MAEEPEIFPQGEEDDVVADFDPDDSIALIDSETAEPLPYGFTWAFDFNAGDISFKGGTPRKAKNLETVNEWISHTLNVEKFESPIYGDAIGTEIYSLVGDRLDAYVMSRVSSEIQQAIEVHDRIEEVNYITSIAIKGNLYVYFTYITDEDIEGQALVQLR